MRKVLVFTAAIALFATQALAVSSIVNSKHDLSSASTGATVKSSNYTEVCVFCHTPHAASTTVTNAPLWNRTTVGNSIATADLYNSTTLTTQSKPTTVQASVQNSDAPLCFSCHDGSSVGDALINPANTSNNAQPAGLVAASMASAMNIYGDTAKMRNDHPIGMNYSLAKAADSGLKATPAGINFYSGKMWCSSCHDVHDDTFRPFLAASNSASALCVKCHDK